jgi:hypothetical protein
LIAITITFNIEIVTEQGGILSLAETTIADETIFSSTLTTTNNALVTVARTRIPTFIGSIV